MTGGSKSDVDNDFFASAMPKGEIGALSFLKEHPDYDGRDVLIAVFDTGVDPGTKGLQITTDGRPKIVDVLDCSGSGDVDTSQIVKLDEHGCITGVNGKVMAVNPHWKNPSGEWHVGVRPAYELFSVGLKRRMKEKRLEKFKHSQREAMTKATQELADFVAAHPKCTEEEDQKQKTELQSRLSLLQSMMTNYIDPGPIIDCVVWNDGTNWRAALDTSEFYEEDEGKGKLAGSIPLTNFYIEHAYGTISEMDACNYVCNIYEDGNLLSIVIDCGMHGTHVSGIAAAYHPESPEFNGVAPGARILMCKIGDTRLGSMENGRGVVRAVIAAINWKADIINASYGEFYALPNSGRLATILNEAVYEHGITLVTSAGNDGPALTTVGACACCQGAISVGAYVSPEMGAAVHSLREEMKAGRQYTFSARGPLDDGTLGVNVSSPGGAISNVPQWCEHSRRMANGTSMAAPNASGGVALLISALKQTGGKRTPARISRALENTAFLPSYTDYQAPPELICGHGLFQVHKAWDYLENAEQVDTHDVQFHVQAKRVDDTEPRGGPSVALGYPSYNKTSGIYIREPQDVGRVLSYNVVVTAVLPKDAKIVSEKVDFEMKLKLKCTCDWVSCPNALLLSHVSMDFVVEVDGSACPDEVNYAEIQALDVNAEWRGPLFRLPITVLNPKKRHPDAVDVELGHFDFEAGTEVRRFIDVPHGATWAELTYTAEEFEGVREYYTTMRQVTPDVRMDATSRQMLLRLKSKEHRHVAVCIMGGRMMELCIAQDWSNFGSTRLSVRIEFHGVNIHQGNQLMLNGACGNLKIQVMAPLRMEKIIPSVSLNVVMIPLRPTESSLVPQTSVIDTLPDARVIHKLTLTYKLKLQEGGKIRPRLPMFNRQMYDCEVETQMVQVFDSNKKLLLFSDVYTSAVTVKKGDFTLIAVIRHDDTNVLKQLEHMSLVVEKTLAREVTVPVHKTHVDSARGGQAIKPYTLYTGQVSTMVIGPLTEALPKDCTPGLVISGTMKLGCCNTTNTASPAKAIISYVVPPEKKQPEVSNCPPEPLPTPASLSNAARDAKVKALEELTLTSERDIKDFETAVAELKVEYPGHLPLLVAVLRKYDALEAVHYSKKMNDILALCEEIVSCIDRVELACFLARKCPDESKEGKKRAKEATEEKEALVMALEKQILTSLKLQDAGTDGVKYEGIKPIFAELRKWADPQEPSLALMHAKFEAVGGRHAEAIKLLDIIINSDKSPVPREVYEFKAECVSKLGWHHWARYEKTHININFPKKFALF